MVKKETLINLGIGVGVGLVVGIPIGVLVGSANTATQNQKRERLYQEAVCKQAGQIKALTKVCQNLQEENACLKYQVGVLPATKDSTCHII